jgi:Leucine Rich repeat
MQRHNTMLTCVGLDRLGDIREAILAIADANRVGARLLNAKGKLNFSSKYVSAEATWQLAKELAGNATVTSLLLSQQYDFGDEGSANIAIALLQNRTLKTLELDKNRISDPGSLSLATALYENATLTHLSLNGNNIGPAGALALAEMFKTNSSLVELALGNNNIFNEGLIAFASALERNASLTRLRLNGNSIGDEGAIALRNVLKERNRTLILLDLQENTNISPTLLEAIHDLVGSRRVMSLWFKHLRLPAADKLMPLVFRTVNQGSIRHEPPDPSQVAKATGNAAVIYHQLKTAASNGFPASE